MTKPVEISHKSWEKLKVRLKEDYPLSAVITRSGMKKYMGVTVRDYRDFDNETLKYKKNCIMLDFYDDKKRTYFLMKYSGYFND